MDPDNAFDIISSSSEPDSEMSEFEEHEDFERNAELIAIADVVFGRSDNSEDDSIDNREISVLGSRPARSQSANGRSNNARSGSPAGNPDALHIVLSSSPEVGRTSAAARNVIDLTGEPDSPPQNNNRGNNNAQNRGRSSFHTANNLTLPTIGSATSRGSDTRLPSINRVPGIRHLQGFTAIHPDHEIHRMLDEYVAELHHDPTARRSGEARSAQNGSNSGPVQQSDVIDLTGETQLPTRPPQFRNRREAELDLMITGSRPRSEVLWAHHHAHVRPRTLPSRAIMFMTHVVNAHLNAGMAPHTPLNYESSPFRPSAPPPAATQTVFDTPEGFTRNTGNPDVELICAGCDSVLEVDPQDLADRASRGKGNKKTAPEHPFWAVKACGHVFCTQCFQNRTKRKRIKPERVGGDGQPEGVVARIVNGKFLCSVDDCDSDIRNKTAWVGLYL